MNNRRGGREFKGRDPRMSLASFPTPGCRSPSVVLAGVAFLGFLAGRAVAADAKRAVNLTVQPSAKPVVSVPTGAELVGKLLAEQTDPSDPDVPLPQRDLTLREPVGRCRARASTVDGRRAVGCWV